MKPPTKTGYQLVIRGPEEQWGKDREYAIAINNDPAHPLFCADSNRDDALTFLRKRDAEFFSLFLTHNIWFRLGELDIVVKKTEVRVDPVWPENANHY